MATIQQNILVDSDWEDILDSLEAEKCVVFMGSGMYQAPSGGNIEAALGDWLGTENPDHPWIQLHQDDGFFLFRNTRKHKRKVIAQIRNFYSQPFPATSAQFAQMAQLPLSIIVSLMPDNILARTFDELGLAYQPDFYFRNRKYPELYEKPNKNKPLIYNLLGNIEEPESLVLTHSDFFDYMKSMFLTHTFHPDFKQELESAERYIFLGLPYGKWYFQLLLRVLSINSDKLKEVERLALREFEDPKLQKLYTEEFKINFFPSSPEFFLRDLYQQCQAAGILKKIPSSDPVDAHLSELTTTALKELIATAQTQPALQQLKIFLERRKPSSYSLINDLVVLRNQYNLLCQRELRGTIDSRDLPVEHNQIAERLLVLIDQAQNL